MERELLTSPDVRAKRDVTMDRGPTRGIHDERHESEIQRVVVFGLRLVREAIKRLYIIPSSTCTSSRVFLRNSTSGCCLQSRCAIFYHFTAPALVKRLQPAQ